MASEFIDGATFLEDILDIEDPPEFNRGASLYVGSSQARSKILGAVSLGSIDEDIGVDDVDLELNALLCGDDVRTEKVSTKENCHSAGNSQSDSAMCKGKNKICDSILSDSEALQHQAFIDVS